MQNFKVENKLLLTENKCQIKSLWQNNFLDDDEKTIEYFLENVFENKKGVGTFLNNELIAMILFLNTKIILKNKKINSVYFYAVCTNEKYRNKGIMKELFSFAQAEARKQGYEICFLVPANDGLFKMYEKFSFETTVFYEEKTYTRDSSCAKKTMLQTTDFCYGDYIRLKEKQIMDYEFVIWENNEFDFIFNKNRSDVSFVFIENGYAIYEKRNDLIHVFEICGNEEDIISCIFKREQDFEKVVLRVPSENRKTDFGMSKSLNNENYRISSVYFGMPYG